MHHYNEYYGNRHGMLFTTNTKYNIIYYLIDTGYILKFIFGYFFLNLISTNYKLFTTYKQLYDLH